MAKKKRRIKEEPEETYEFAPTEFDEKEFILKELFNTKVFFAVIFLALLSGIIWSLTYTLGQNMWLVGLLVCVLLIVFMKKLLALFKVRVDMIDSKSMIANYAMYFLLALGITILLINPPFY
ncbi:MAG: hypothetical protein AB7D42_04245 [Candidatus Methanomethylophilaceae archaeon]|nr:hypothetical protein [Candidatus Methanomethylophilaceae archaeon]